MSSKQPAPPRKGALGVVWLTIFIDLVGFSIIFPIFPAMLEWYLPREGDTSFLHGLIELFTSITPGGNQEFLVAVLFGGFLGSLYSFLQFFSSPFWGGLSDRLGRRHILLITTIGTAFSYILWAVSGSFWVLLVSRAIGGLMSGNISVATAAVADLTDSRNRSKGMALIGVAFGLGFIIGPAIGGLGSVVDLGVDVTSSAAFALTPFSFPALVAAALAILNVIWVWRAFPETLSSEKRQKPNGKSLLRIRLGSENADVKVALRVYFLFIFAFAGMEFTLTFLALERLLYDPRQMPLIFITVGIALALTQGGVVRRYGHRIGERNLTTAGLLASTISLVCLSVSHAPVLFYTGLVLLGVGTGCVSPSLSALVSLYTSAERQGTELGAYRSVGALGRAMGPLYGAALFWSMGSNLAYLASAILIFIAALASLFLPKPTA